MKKILLVVALIIIIFGCLLMLLMTPDKLIPDNPAGKTVYYTIVNDFGVENEDKRYDYKLTAYNKKGKEKMLEFSAGKQLREGAYLQLYYTKLRGVTHWEEVTFEELPKTVQQLYTK